MFDVSVKRSVLDASARGADDDEDGLDGVDGDDVALSFANQE